MFVCESPPTYTSPGATMASSCESVWHMPYWPIPYLKWRDTPCDSENRSSLATFSADIFSADGTKWSSAIHTRDGSHSLEVSIPSAASRSNTLITPGPDTSWTMARSIPAKTTSPGDTERRSDARASIFSVTFTPGVMPAAIKTYHMGATVA